MLLIFKTHQIRLKGLASGKETIYTNSNTAQSLLRFLEAQNIGVASSCNGQGQCQKCVVTLNGEEYLSCQIGLEKGLSNNASLSVFVDYL